VAITLRPLTDTLRGNRPASEQLVWSPETEAGFVAAKAALRRDMWLGHLYPMAQLALHVGASAPHIGAALHQRLRGHMDWQPLGFFSSKLELPRLSAYYRGLYACVEGIRHFGLSWRAGLYG
jgi:hypothetical protein